MYAKFNFVETQKLELNSINAQVEWLENTPEFTMTWNLSDLGFELSNDLILEIWSIRSTQHLRFNLGQVKNGIGKFKTKLHFFEELEAIRCRFKVVKKYASGRPCFVASIDGFKPQIKDENFAETGSLLAIQSDDAMKFPWQLRFENGEPTLYLYSEISQSLRNRAQAPWFHPLILSEILGQVFDWLADSTNRDDSVASKLWEEFMIGLGCPTDFWLTLSPDINVAPRQDVSEVRLLVMNKFAVRHNFVHQLTDILREEEIQI